MTEVAIKALVALVRSATSLKTSSVEEAKAKARVHAGSEAKTLCCEWMLT
jgi:hypothetical protein